MVDLIYKKFVYKLPSWSWGVTISVPHFIQISNGHFSSILYKFNRRYET